MVVYESWTYMYDADVVWDQPDENTSKILHPFNSREL